jgi:hypothetical protein
MPDPLDLVEISEESRELAAIFSRVDQIISRESIAHGSRTGTREGKSSNHRAH